MCVLRLQRSEMSLQRENIAQENLSTQEPATFELCPRSTGVDTDG